MKYYVYILYAPSLDIYYVGQTNNLDQRLERHLQGRERFTRRARDWVLVYQEECPTRASARKREKEIKSMKSRPYITKLVSSYLHMESNPDSSG